MAHRHRVRSSPHTSVLKEFPCAHGHRGQRRRPYSRSRPASPPPPSAVPPGLPPAAEPRPPAALALPRPPAAAALPWPPAAAVPPWPLTAAAPARAPRPPSPTRPARSAAPCPPPARTCSCWGYSSECADWAYDSPSEGSLPAAVSVERELGQFPVSVLGVVGQDPPRGVASVSGRSAGQVYDEVGVLGHRSYCAQVHRRFNLRY